MPLLYRGWVNVGKVVNEMDGGSGSGGQANAMLAFSDKQEKQQQRLVKKKRHHRHAERQIQEMETELPSSPRHLYLITILYMMLCLLMMVAMVIMV